MAWHCCESSVETVRATKEVIRVESSVFVDHSESNQQRSLEYIAEYFGSATIRSSIEILSYDWDEQPVLNKCCWHMFKMVQSFPILRKTAIGWMPFRTLLKDTTLTFHLHFARVTYCLLIFCEQRYVKLIRPALHDHVSELKSIRYLLTYNFFFTTCFPDALSCERPFTLATLKENADQRLYESAHSSVHYLLRFNEILVHLSLNDQG